MEKEIKQELEKSENLLIDLRNSLDRLRFFVETGFKPATMTSREYDRLIKKAMELETSIQMFGTNFKMFSRSRRLRR